MASSALYITREAPKNSAMSVRPLQSSSRFNALRTNSENARVGEKACVQVDASLRAQLRSKEALIDAANSELMSIRRQLEAALADLKTAQTENEDLSAQLDKNSSQLQNVTDAVARTEALLRTSQSLMEEREKQWKGTSSSLQKELQTKDNELNHLRAEVAVARRALLSQKRLKDQLAVQQAVAANEARKLSSRSEMLSASTQTTPTLHGGARNSQLCRDLAVPSTPLLELSRNFVLGATGTPKGKRVYIDSGVSSPRSATKFGSAIKGKRFVFPESSRTVQREWSQAVSMADSELPETDGGLFSWLYTPFWRPASHADNPWLVLSCFVHQVHFLTPRFWGEDDDSEPTASCVGISSPAPPRKLTA